MYIGLHVKYRHSCSILMKIDFSRQIFEKFSNIKFHENPSTRSRVVAYGQADMTKLIVALRNFLNAPKVKEWARSEGTMVHGEIILQRDLKKQREWTELMSVRRRSGGGML